jgi:hypothetical protein
MSISRLQQPEKLLPSSPVGKCRLRTEKIGDFSKLHSRGRDLNVNKAAW